MNAPTPVPAVANPAPRDAATTGDLMVWARERAAALVAELPVDSPLRGLLSDAAGLQTPDLPPPRAPTTEAPSIATNIEPLADGAYRVRTRCETWPCFVQRFGGDLVQGRCFVESVSPLPLGASVNLRIELPHGAKDLGLQGDIVHVRGRDEAFDAGLQPGFGLALQLSSIRRQKLREVVASATQMSAADERPPTGSSASSSCLRLFVSGEEEALLSELQHELRALQASDDRTRLGLPRTFEEEELYAAFFRRSQHWRDRGAGRSGEVHTMVEAIVDLLQVSCARLRASSGTSAAVVSDSAPLTLPPLPDPDPQPTPQPSPAFAEHEAGSETSPNVDVEPSAVPREVEASPSSGPISTLMRARLRSALSNARKVLGVEPQAAPTPPANSSSSRRSTLEEAMTTARHAIGDKDYVRAQEVLRAVLPGLQGAQANTVRVWLLFAEAREAASMRQLDRAIECYQSALRLDPHFKLAEKELVIVRCVSGGGA